MVVKEKNKIAELDQLALCEQCSIGPIDIHCFNQVSMHLHVHHVKPLPRLSSENLIKQCISIGPICRGGWQLPSRNNYDHDMNWRSNAMPMREEKNLIVAK